MKAGVNIIILIILTEAGFYKFDATVKGNSAESVGTPVEAEVLWESFGTGTAPAAGSLIKAVGIMDGYVMFTATDGTGNAVIAVRDENREILWSWHIWLAGKQPQGQTYYHDAGTMMDRNLGATSAEKGNSGALGLLYQWGRKDPFLGSSEIDNEKDNSKIAKSTPGFPDSEAVSSSNISDNTTLAYSISHPTVFLTNDSSTHDWYCNTQENQNNALWGSSKTMYDPCPAGWRVPGGGADGVWTKASNQAGSWTEPTNWDGDHLGMDFGKIDYPFGSGTIWYPAAGHRFYGSGDFLSGGDAGYYWSSTVYDGTLVHYFFFLNDGKVRPADYYYRANGFPVRCLKE